MEYADDVDFIDEEKQPLDLLPTAGVKTEFTHVFLANTQEDDKEDAELRGKEKWRKSKILGSLLCSSSDITVRCIMGNIAFLLEALDPRIKNPSNN